MKNAMLIRILRVAALGLCLPTVGQAQRGSAGYIPQLYAGQEALRAKKWTSAGSYFRTALEWNRRGVDAHNGLGMVYLHTGRPQRAEEEFRAALHLKPHSAEAERGIHEARTPGQEEAAFVALEAQVKQEPNNPDVHTTYAEELLERNRVAEAQKEAEIALRLDPKQGHAYCALGRIAAKEGRDDEARKDLEIAVKRDNTDDDAFAYLGDLAMKTKDYKQAAIYYRHVVNIVPDETEAYEKLAEALTAGGDAAGAAKVRAALSSLALDGKR